MFCLRVYIYRHFEDRANARWVYIYISTRSDGDSRANLDAREQWESTERVSELFAISKDQQVQS